jgi:hypothetical protein
MNFISKILNKIKEKTMKKSLELDEKTARKLYLTAAPEFKELLEENFGKEFFNQKIKDRIRDYNDILEISKVAAEADDVKVIGFDDAENNVVKAFIQKMRTTKVYREGKLPKRGDKRYYTYYNVSSGFVFDFATCGDAIADTASASRLCLLSDEDARDYDKKFRHIEEALIDLK